MVSLMVFAVCADEENQESSAATCYVCNSNEDSSCDDAYTGLDKHKQACENGETFCRTIIQKGKWLETSFIWMKIFDSLRLVILNFYCLK